MAVSSFGSATTAVDTTEKWVRLAASGTDYWLNLQMLVGTGNSIAGFYTFKFYADTATTPTGTVKTYDSSFVLGTTTTTLDRDTGSTANYSEMYLSLTDSTPFVTVSSTSAGYLVAQKLPEKAGVFAPITVYSTSQTVTITNSSPFVLIGGGGGGGSIGGPVTGVGGGGSGYLQKNTVQPGSYSLVIGAGGAAGGAGGSTGGGGGASTFAGYTANGGNPGNATTGDIWSGANGGNGGSGGGPNGGGAGGSNGSNGSNGVGFGGTGSGVTSAAWYPTGSGGGSNGNGYGNGGGVYGGGGGGWSNSYTYGGGGAGAVGGGGGGVGNGGNAGGPGGKGALIVFGG